MENRPMTISKLLSANDTGESGSHQAGILVPRNPDILSFFPSLDRGTKNPRIVIDFIDESGAPQRFTYIYYNNKFFDTHGTRNEYRLTGMTKYLRNLNAKSGDTLVFSRDDNGRYSISLQRAEATGVISTMKESGKRKVVLRPSNSWKIVEI